MTKSSRWLITGILAPVILLIANIASAKAEVDGSGKESQVLKQGDVMRVLAEEKTLGEAGVSLLNQYAKNNQKVYVRGIVLYAEAKAKFDGLIKQLKDDLNEGRRPDRSPLFQQFPKQTSDKRQAFFNFVVQEVAPAKTGTKGVADSFTAAAALIPAGSDAALKIWKEFRDGKATRREEIRRQLDAQKWLPFERLSQGKG